MSNPIYIALGANLPSIHGHPAATLQAALGALERLGVTVVNRSPWYETVPEPRSDQPNYVNGVAQVDTDLSAPDLLALLHRVEADFGRVRIDRNEARLIDLDLIDYGGLVMATGGEGLMLPHPRAYCRGFVLVPLRDIAPDWRHPETGRGIDALIGDLPDRNGVTRL